jgi:uncharacterized glyoxalase superfamily protein PhnB
MSSRVPYSASVQATTLAKTDGGESSMKENRSVPRSTITPTLIYNDMEKAIDWLGRTFGLKEVWRIEDHGALLSLDGAEVYVRGPRKGKAFDVQLASSCSASLMVRVEDVNSHYERALRRDVEILQEPRDEVYGERQYTVADVGGHHWTFSETTKDVAPEEWGATLARQ